MNVGIYYRNNMSKTALISIVHKFSVFFGENAFIFVNFHNNFFLKKQKIVISHLLYIDKM